MSDPNNTNQEPATKKAAAKPRRWRRRLGHGTLGVLGGVALVALASCIHLPRHNPAYPATNAEIDSAIQAMQEAPTGVERPVLVLSGWRSPPLTGHQLAKRIRDLTGADQDQVLAIGYVWGSDIPAIADQVALRAADEFGSVVDPVTGDRRTVEIDVVAISMGGLVARTASAEPARVGRAEPLRMDIHTLYTLGTPHRGARLANWIRLDDASRQMQAGSHFLTTLDQATLNTPQGPAIVPYATLRDSWVGATNAAPNGQDPIWVPGRLVLSHHLISLDERILADLARRLRGEPPLAEPSAPPRN